MKRLNNLVVELASLPALAAGDKLKLTNPREGWVFISTAPGEGEHRSRRPPNAARQARDDGDLPVEAHSFIGFFVIHVSGFPPSDLSRGLRRVLRARREVG